MAKNNRRKPSGFKSTPCMLMDCMPGNADHAEGEPITVVTLAGVKSGDIFPVFLTLTDSRKLAVALLVSLYTSDDGFAEKVLTEMFPSDDDGKFHWPRT